MRGTVPPELSTLLEASDDVGRDQAWAKFVDRFSPILLSTARKLAPNYDRAMDRYRFVLEELQRNDYQRLRGYAADSRSTFANWLIVVANRLCFDFHRARYGRVRRSAAENPGPGGTGPGARGDETSEGDPTPGAAERSGQGPASAADEARAVRRRLADFDVEELDPATTSNPGTTDPTDRVWAQQLDRALGSATEDLDPRDRLILKLRFQDELPVREIAGVMGFSSVFQVYRRLKALSALLRARLEERGIDGIVS